MKKCLCKCCCMALYLQKPLRTYKAKTRRTIFTATFFNMRAKAENNTAKIQTQPQSCKVMSESSYLNVFEQYIHKILTTITYNVLHIFTLRLRTLSNQPFSLVYFVYR